VSNRPLSLAGVRILAAILKPIFATKATAEWIALLTGEVPCAPVNDLATALAEPQVVARGMIAEIEHPRRGTIRDFGCPIRMDDATMPLRHAPLVGEQTEEVLMQAGYSAAEIAALHDAGIVR
jgi:crotonobetainyl-CoA:carnitine CoA-transferase CaiB-like acyl-CoA transferase